MNLMLVTLLSVLVVVCFFGTAEGIKCHTCATTDQKCGDCLDKSKYPARDCAADQDSCFKSINDGIVSRGCNKKANKDIKMECSGDKNKMCLCSGDGCNGSGTITPGFFLMGVTAAFMTAYRFY